MPALITHFLLVKRIEEDLTEKNIDFDSASLYWGSQGPDFLFYHKAVPLFSKKSIRKLGSFLHKLPPIKVFEAMKEYIFRECREKDLIYAKSYAYGFLAHLALDSYAHPYVYWFQKILGEKISQDPGLMHHKIEYNIDVIMLYRELNLKPADFRISKAIPGKFRAIRAQARMMSYVISKIIGQGDLPERKIRQAYRDCRLYARLSHDKTGFKRRLAKSLEKKFSQGIPLSSFVRPLEPQTDWDYVNSQKSRWPVNGDIGSKISTKDFFDIFDKACEVSVDIINKFRDCAEYNQPIYFLEGFRFNNGSK